VDLRVQLGKLVVKNPVIIASGTFSFEYRSLVDIGLLGGVVTKSVTLSPREGNPMPRICEVSCGLLNSIGLANPGVDEFSKCTEEY